MSAEDDDLLRSLGEALDDGGERTPPPERIAALRARADARARELPSTGEGGTSGRRTSGRRDLLVGGIAASIGAAAGLIGGRALGDDADPAPPMEAIAFTGTPPGVRTEASLINHTWGVELLLDVEGLTPGTTYDIIYEGPDGPLAAGSFLAVEVPMACRFNGARLRADTTAIALTASDGTEVGRAELA